MAHSTPKPSPKPRSTVDEACSADEDEATVQDTDEQASGEDESEDGSGDGPGDEATSGDTAEEIPVDEQGITAERGFLRRIRPQKVMGALLVLALVAVLAYVTVEFFAQRAENAARAAALDAAQRYAIDLSSYDFENLDDNFQAVEQNSTGEFGEQYRKVSQNLTELIEQHEATSEASVLSAGVVEASTDHAVIVLFVDQTITNTNSPQPRIDRNRMQMTLVHQDDHWLVDDVTLL